MFISSLSIETTQFKVVALSNKVKSRPLNVPSYPKYFFFSSTVKIDSVIHVDVCSPEAQNNN